MTAVATPLDGRAVGTAEPAYRLRFDRVLRSEWIKTLTVRSTWWSIAVVVGLSVGISMLIAVAMTSAEALGAEGDAPAADPLSAILDPTQFTILLAAVVGAITVTGEYATGMIRSTLTAEPRRGSVLAAKAIVVASLLAVTAAAVFAVSAAAMSFLLPTTPIDWSDPLVSSVPLLYGVLSMAAFALIGLGLGFIIGNGAGAIAAAVGLVFLLPPLVSLFPSGASWQWIHDLGAALPGPAAQALMTPGAETGLGDGMALLALAAWVTAMLGVAWVVLRRRDA